MATQLKVWAWVSQKGGAGKSTLCTQMGVLAQQKGERVVIVDLDPQGSAALWGSIRVAHSKEPRVTGPAQPERLSNVIQFAQEFGFTLMMIDTQGHTDASSLISIKAADLILCPTQPTFFELEAMSKTVELIELCKKKHVARAIVNHVTPGQPAVQIAEYQEAVSHLERLQLQVCERWITNRKAIPNAIANGRSVTELKTREAKVPTEELIELWDELTKIEIEANTNVIPLERKA